MTTALPPIFGSTLPELEAIARSWGEPDIVAAKIARWIYRRGVCDFAGMNDLSLGIRKNLSENFTGGILPYSGRQVSVDGSVKYIFETADGRYYEAVYLPETKRHTLCVSSQSGCRMGCRFCRTASLGFKGNLEVHELLSQLFTMDERKLITHVVFMGMGEPLDNYTNVQKCIDILKATWGFAISVRNITVSTVGISPHMQHFLQHSRCNLALSLHSPFEEERQALIPVENVWPFRELLSELRSFSPGKKRRITVQYTLIGGFNDRERQLQALVNLLRGTHLRVNLITFNPFHGCDYRAPDADKINLFMKTLNGAGISTTVRRSRGADIGAACGLLGAASNQAN